MFITGPDVVKTVTGEEVTLEGARRRHVARHQVGRGHLRLRRRAPCLDDVRSCSASCRSTTSRSRRRVGAARRPRAPVPRAVRDDAGVAEHPLRHERGHPQPSSTTASSSSTSPTGRDRSRVRLRPARRPAGRRRRQPADDPRRRARHRQLGEGGPLRADVRRLQHPARHVRRRARLPARRRPGVRRHHPPRRQAPLRLLRGHGAPHPGDHPQGVRRRLRRHELEVDRRRPGVRLAVGRAGGDGPAGCGRDRLPQGAGQRRRSGGQARPSWSTSTPSASATPTSPPSGASSTT